MSAKGMLFAMVAGTALVILVTDRRDAEPSTSTALRPAETPWLTPEAAAQVVGPEAGLGPLFDGVTLGGPAPAPEVHARIAKFARANNVDIDVEIADGAVAAVRFAVSYSGCCGYEGADVLALRLKRFSTGACTGPDRWIDDWAVASEDGVYMRGRVRVNRVEARWQRALTLAQVIERTDQLVGTEAPTDDDERWTQLARSHYVLELPYPPIGSIDGYARELRRPDEGVQVAVERGQIVQTSFAFWLREEDMERAAKTIMQSLWGRARKRDGVWTWQTSDRIVTAELGFEARITIRTRSR